jgi:serine/threonine-protein kinase
MGEVYRARDTKLDRDVAIKILPEAFADDPERVARFQREAKTLAALNHPNIGGIYGLEEAAVGPAEAGRCVRALVLELVEGPTLADRIAHGPIPVSEALPIARQIAEALEAAHEPGIIHRDLKPANVKVRNDGMVKVLDFGLAKGLQPSSSADDRSQAPTLTTAAATRIGAVMGTATYMSPEQAKGKPVDKRTDVWAFGCVLYEMLTGRRAFGAGDVTDTIVAVVSKEPDWTALPSNTPPAIHRLLRRCLAKDRHQRLADLATARLEIVEALTAPASEPLPYAARPASRRRRLAAVVSVAALLAAALAGTLVWLATRPALPRIARVTITPAGAAALTINGTDRDLTITPDGTRVVYVGNTGRQIFVRPLDQLDPAAIATGGVLRGVFTSPDGQWVGFVEGTRTLQKVSITGGPAMTLAALDGTSRGATWLPDETIVFATFNPATGLQRIPAAGGPVTLLTRPNRDRGEADHLWPERLPGGRAILFTITPLSGGLDAAQVAVLDLATGAQTTLVRGGSHAHYVASGHLVYAVGGSLRAVAFDLSRLAVRGTPAPVLPRLMTTTVGAADFVVAEDGTLVYVDAPAGRARTRTLVWVDRQGREEPLAAPPRPYQHPRVSPDGNRIVVVSADQEQDLWRWDLPRGPLTRLTFEPGIDADPVWTPDGRRLVFASQGTDGSWNLFWQGAEGAGVGERLTDSGTTQIPTGMTPDGRQVVFYEVTASRGRDLKLLALGGDRSSSLRRSAPSTGSEPLRGLSRADDRASQGEIEGRQAEPRPEPGREAGGFGHSEPVGPRRMVPLLETRFDERNGVISPDGRWLAYESDSSGQFEVYVRPFPNVEEGQWQVSTAGGEHPLWARSGRELFYVAPDGALMAVRADTRGARWQASTPTKLLEGRYVVGGAGILGRHYDASPDGQRFLLIKQAGADTAAAPPQIVIVQNWFEELKRLVPTN